MSVRSITGAVLNEESTPPRGIDLQTWQAILAVASLAREAKDAALSAANHALSAHQNTGAIMVTLARIEADVQALKLARDSMRPKLESVPELVEHVVDRRALATHEQTAKENRNLKAALVVAIVGGIAAAVASHFIH